MKGSEKIIAKLNELLSLELAAINQYIVHAEMNDNWKYNRLHESIEGRAKEEMKHASMLISRILFLEGKPIVEPIAPVHVGESVPVQFHADLAAEMNSINTYASGIMLAEQLLDYDTRDIFQSILKDEQKHVNYLESQLIQISNMTLENYLSTQNI